MPDQTFGRVENDAETAVTKSMENAPVLTLSALCLGIAMTGLFSAVLGQGTSQGPSEGHLREKICLALIYLAFIGMIALPLVKAFAAAALNNYMPLLLILLLVLPPAFYHFIAAKTAKPMSGLIPWHDLVLPLVACVVCIGYWTLPPEAKRTLFVAGDLPPGIWPAVLTFVTFALILIWLIASFLYLIAILRRLAVHRAEIRELYSDVEKRDLRWVDGMMVLLVLIWAVGAFSLADDNLAGGRFFIEEVFLVLIAAGLLSLNLFAGGVSPDPDIGSDQTPEPDTEEDIGEEPPASKYARSALTDDHAVKLASRLDAVMRKDALYLDPSLSLQKLSQHVGALPNQVSQTLNQEIGTSFFDYVARWRIEASKPMIMAGDASVLTTALEVGFNSRSTFYKAFKRETGMTPKAYRATQHVAG